LAAMVNKVLSGIGFYFPWGAQPFWRHLLVLGFGCTALIASLLVVLILFPITNPALNVRLIPGPNGPTFFLTQLTPKSLRRFFSRSPRFSRLAQEHSEYIRQVSTASEAALLQAISGEVLKVSYIRQIKTDRLRAVTIALATCAVLFVVLTATDAKFPQPSKPALVQIQGPVTMNTTPVNTTTPSTSSGAQAGSTPQVPGVVGVPTPSSTSSGTPIPVPKP
jgi:hypothetical protein